MTNGITAAERGRGCGKLWLYVTKTEMVREGPLRGRGEKTETLMLERKERKCIMSDRNGGKKNERKDKKEREDLEESQITWVVGEQREGKIKSGRTWWMKIKGGERGCRSYKKKSTNENG